MSIDIYQNYSQFYKGTESLKTYGSNNRTGKKDTLVKYEFNTTDEYGNKVMDKMSKEETLRVMKEISAQYGDDVIVEFSGDGMAALVESKKNGHDVDLDKIMNKTPEQQAVPDDMITQLEGTYRRVSENDEVNTHISWHDTLREKAPDICNELDDLMQQILDHGLNHNDDGEKFGAKFIELVTKAEKAISAYDAKKESAKDIAVDKAEKTATVGETQLSKKAQALLKKLRKTYGDIDFFVADFKNAEEAKAALSRGTKKVSVLFSSEELEKMASDERYEKECMDRVQGALRMSDEINRKYGFESAFGKDSGNGEITKIGISFNSDGTTSFFAELEKSSASQRERIEKTREERRAQRKEDAKKAEREKQKERLEGKADYDVKRTTVQADSMEELLEKIRNVDWNIIQTGNESEVGRKFDFSI